MHRWEEPFREVERMIQTEEMGRCGQNALHWQRHQVTNWARGPPSTEAVGSHGGVRSSCRSRTDVVPRRRSANLSPVAVAAAEFVAVSAAEFAAVAAGTVTQAIAMHGAPYATTDNTVDNCCTVDNRAVAGGVVYSRLVMHHLFDCPMDEQLQS